MSRKKTLGRDSSTGMSRDKEFFAFISEAGATHCTSTSSDPFEGGSEIGTASS